MTKNRIIFEGNPWPEGHPIKKLVWVARLIEGDVWFDITLETHDYSSERGIEYDENIQYLSDWEHPKAWANYHRCEIWNEGTQGFKVCKEAEYSKEFFDGFEVNVDSDVDFNDHEWEDFTFSAYIMGHDAVTDHCFKFKRNESSDLFDICWTGQIALAYAGDYDFKYKFKVTFNGVQFPELNENA